MAAGRIPRWVWIFTPLISLGFVGFLFYLTTVPAGDDIDKITGSLGNVLDAKVKQIETKPPIDKQDATSKKQVTEQAPKAKIENYEFYELLENKKVDVPKVDEYVTTPKGTDKDGNKLVYRLRAGAFSSQEGADRLKAMLTLNGMDTQVELAEVNGKKWYRVFVGPYNNRSKMNKAQDVLAGMDIQSMVIKETTKK